MKGFDAALSIIKKYFWNVPLKRKILVIIVLVNILLVGTISFIGIDVVVNANNRLLYQTIAGSLSYSAKDIQVALNRIETMSYSLIADDVVQKQLAAVKQSIHPVVRSEAYKQLNLLLQTYMLQFKSVYLSYISIYNENITVHTYAPFAQNKPQEITDEIIRNAIYHEGAPLWTTEYSNDYGLFLSRAVRKIENMSMETLGVINICVDIDEMIENAADLSSRYEEAYYLLFDQSRMVYHSKQLSEQAAQNIRKQLNSDYDVIKMDGHRYFAVRGTIPVYGWDYISLVSYDKTYKAIMLSSIFYLSIMLFCIVLSVLVSDFLVNIIIRHFDNLIIKMKAFGTQGIKLVDVGYNYENREDEIGLLHRQFDNMAAEIRELIEVNYTNKLLMKDAQLKALETQINPHFLYNILESINWRAKAIGEKQISQMVESLGKLLRAALGKTDESFNLSKEIELVNSYMTIQQIRFEDQLHFQLDVPQSLLCASIPKLTIQPLVENAIHYSLEQNTEDCFIKIEVKLVDGDIIIDVKNTGSQFEDNLLEKLTQSQIKPHGFGIGLLNIHNRIQLTFGEAYGLEFFNENGNAVARVKIPFSPAV